MVLQWSLCGPEPLLSRPLGHASGMTSSVAFVSSHGLTVRAFLLGKLHGHLVTVFDSRGRVRKKCRGPEIHTWNGPGLRQAWENGALGERYHRPCCPYFG